MRRAIQGGKMPLGWGVIRLLLLLALIKSSLQYCYQMKLLGASFTETPDYRFVIYFHNNDSLSSVTRVLREIPIPLWHLQLVQHTTERKGLKKFEATKVLYNATYKVCEFWKYVKRIRLFNNVAHILFDAKSGSNMTVTCPLSVGTYVFNDVHVPPDTGILKFMYWPNTIYTLYGTVYSLLPDKTWEKKCTYTVNATVLKSC